MGNEVDLSAIAVGLDLVEHTFGSAWNKRSAFGLIGRPIGTLGGKGPQWPSGAREVGVGMQVVETTRIRIDDRQNEADGFARWR